MSRRPGDVNGGADRYSDFLYPTDPTDRKGDNKNSFSAGAIPVTSTPDGSDGVVGGGPNYDMYEDESLSTEALRDQVERLLHEEEAAERAEREKLLKMRAQLLERKRKREQDGLRDR